jgi:N-acetylneuraminate synthase
VAPDAPCLVIAEAGVNHNGDPALAERLVDVAAAAGADMVKFQTFRADRIVTSEAPKAAYQRAGADDGESQRDMLRALELSEDGHRRVVARARAAGIVFLSTPFDEEAADFLASLGVPAFKIPSGEITNLPFLAHVARHARPIIMSTGMATLAEVEAAVRTVREAGCEDLVLLHCVSSYPAAPADANLRAMATLAAAFGVPVGYSDHTPGLEVALAARALGACVIEKHFTTSRALPGPDHAMSIEPDELAALVRGIRIVEAALGDGIKRPVPAEIAIAAVARKSLVVTRDLPAGSVLTREALGARRPGTGLAPAELSRVVGRTLRRPVRAGTLLSFESLE